jgi:hypothetical protein
MNIEITSIAGAGDINHERVVMKVNATADNTGVYAIFEGDIGEKGFVVAGKIDNTYWFTNVEVRPGD